MKDSQTKATLITVGICVCIIGTLIYMNESDDNYTPSSYSDYESRYMDSISNAITEKYNNHKYDQNADKLDSSIKIINYYTSDPNSAGGVDVNIEWKNISNRTVKYAYFRVVPYNAVDDIQECRISKESKQYLSITGPIKPGGINGKYSNWENVWWNYTISYMKIVSIELEYMDGFKIQTTNPEIIKSVLPNKSK